MKQIVKKSNRCKNCNKKLSMGELAYWQNNCNKCHYKNNQKAFLIIKNIINAHQQK